MRLPPIVVSLLLCILGYLGVALALLPGAPDTLADDVAVDEAREIARR